MRRATRDKLIGLAAAAAVLALLATSCTNEEALAPTAVATPSPSPTPPDTDALSCKQTNLSLKILNGAGNPDILFDYRELINALAAPVNRAGAVLPQRCDFGRVVGWSIRGPVCDQYGDRNGFSTFFQCADTGVFSITATHGDFKAVWDGLLIRNRDGSIPVGLPEGPTVTHYRLDAAGVYRRIPAPIELAR